MTRGVAQLASALAWGARGRKFESYHPDHITIKVVKNFSKRDESHAFFINDLCLYGAVLAGFSFSTTIRTTPFYNL